jgi:hypothetical protein
LHHLIGRHAHGHVEGHAADVRRHVHWHARGRRWLGLEVGRRAREVVHAGHRVAFN